VNLVNTAMKVNRFYRLLNKEAVRTCFHVNPHKCKSEEQFEKSDILRMECKYPQVSKHRDLFAGI